MLTNHKLWLGLACIVVVFVILRARTTMESFDPMAAAIKEVTSGEVKASKKSIASVALTSLVARAPKSSNVFARIFRGAPAYSVIVKARPKYTLVNGVLVIGKSFTVEGFGETKASALTNAYKKADTTRTKYVISLRNAGLMKI